MFVLDFIFKKRLLNNDFQNIVRGQGDILAKVDGDIHSKSNPSHYVIYFTETVVPRTILLCTYVTSQL